MSEWYRLVQVDGHSPEEVLALSPVLAETVAASVAAGTAPPTVLLRRQRPYVLLGPRDERLPGLPAGIAYLKARGLPVYRRIGGGSAVLLDGDCISFAVARPCRDVGMVDRNYRALTAGVFAGLGRMGLSPRFGAAPGSYCEGPYDLVAEGRKIAGVAQALRGGFTVVSGMILVRQDPAAATALLNGFYRAAGAAGALRPGAVTNLERLLGRPVTVDEVEQHLLAGFAACFRLAAAELTPAELERARRLQAIRRVG